MPRRKKLPENPDYTDFGRNDSTALVVQKTKPLLSLSETSLTLPEFKILDAYLARVNSHDPEKRYVTLERGEIERYLGVTQIKMPDLEKRIKNLFQTITIKDPNKPKGFKLIALFEKAECLQDEDGLWQVHLAASYSAMEYIFTPENIGYLRYYLGDVANLTSRYSYILYLYLENNRYRKSWQVSVSELKEMLRCTADTYSQFYRFNDLILKRCQRELNEKTKCRFSYSSVKRGRSVVAVRFTLETRSDAAAVGGDPDGQYTLEDWQAAQDDTALTPERSRRDDICHGFGNPIFDGFSDEELEFLKEIAWRKADQGDIETHRHLIGNYPDAIQYAVTDYLSAKVRMAQTKKPKNLFLYVKKMVENDK